MRRKLAYYTAAALAAALGVSVIALRFLPLPWLWIGLTWGAVGYAMAAWAPRALQMALVIASSFPVALALAELAVRAPPQISQSVVPPLDERDSLLGWRPKPAQVSRATAKVGDEVIYDVMYSIDRAGHRIAPPDRGTKIEGCLLFFSDSFAFGEGVGDQQAFPYQVGQMTDGRFRVVNLAFSGYGAEHMLATLESGALTGSLPCEPTHIFYSALPHHVPRAAGKTAFSIRGPRYALSSTGVPQYLGTSADLLEPGLWRQRLLGQLSKSRVYRAIRARPPEPAEADLQLYFALVREAFRLAERRWSGAELHLISWHIHDFYARNQAAFHEGLNTTGFQVHFIDRILPGYSADPTPYSLHRFELHPNASAHRLVASYLAEQVLAARVSAAH